MITERDFWNHRSQNYDEQIGPQYERAYQLTAERTLAYLKLEDRVLDFACGTGIVTLSLSPDVKELRGIDISDEMIRRAQGKAAAQGIANVLLTQTDLFDDSLAPASFDAVLACNVLLYVEQRAEVLARICALLRPGGMFLSATDCLGVGMTRERMRKWFEYRTGKRPFVAFDTRETLAQDILRAGFEIVEQEDLFPAPPNRFIAARKK